MSRKRKDHWYLINGCSCTAPKISPANWDKAGASIKKDWFVWYRYFDPSSGDYPKGKLCPVKNGVNEYRTLAERRQYIKVLLQDEEQSLKEQHWNPIRQEYMVPTAQEMAYIVSPSTPWPAALQSAYNLMECVDTTLANLRTCIHHTSAAINDLKLHRLPVSEVRRSHIFAVLQKIKENRTADIARSKTKVKRPFTNRTYNYYRSHISMLFGKLFEIQATELNPVEGIRPLKADKKLPQSLTEEQRKVIDTRLKEDKYELWRTMHIYYHGGSRRTEIVGVMGKDVNLIAQKYRARVKKGNAYREVERTIPKAALPYWIEIMKECGPTDYIISRGMKPGPIPVKPEALTRNWRRWVKDRYGIDVNWNSLRHSNTTEVVNEVESIIMEAMKIAANQNQHSVKILKKHYDLNPDRKHDLLKHSERKFV